MFWNEYACGHTAKTHFLHAQKIKKKFLPRFFPSLDSFIFVPWLLLLTLVGSSLTFSFNRTKKVSKTFLWLKNIQEKAATFFPGKNLHYKPKKYLDSYKRNNFFCLVHFKNRETSKILNSVFFDCFSQLVISFSANFFCLDFFVGSSHHYISLWWDNTLICAIFIWCKNIKLFSTRKCFHVSIIIIIVFCFPFLLHLIYFYIFIFLLHFIYFRVFFHN